MYETEALRIFTRTGAVLAGGHFVYKSRRHGTAYVNWKPEVARKHIEETDLLCSGLAGLFREHQIDAVIGPATGGILISQLVRHYLRKLSPGDKVLAFYIEKEQPKIVLMQYDRHLYHNISSVRSDCVEHLAEKRVLVVDDVLTTGISVRRVVEAVRSHGGDPIAVGVLCNRGGVTKEAVGTHELKELVNLPLVSWSEEECALSGPCSRDIPVNKEFGHGKEFLAKKKK